MSQIIFRDNESGTVVSVIIPVYKDLPGLKDTITSLKRCVYPESLRLEIIVVNDGASEEISGYCSTEHLVEVSISPNKGSYYARNRGLECSTGSYIGFVDADIIVNPDWVAQGVNALSSADYVAGAIQVLKQNVSQTVVDYQQLIDFNTLWHMQSMHYGPTANIWITRKVIAEIGGFNEALFSGGDMDFGIRVHACGRLTPVFAERVAVSHPPRNFLGLLQKSKRLAYGHTVSHGHKSLESKFSFINSVKRNLGQQSAQRKIPFNVQCLRIFLYGHRLLLKIYYKLFLRDSSFEKVVNSSPVIQKNDFSLAKEA